jgi:16S rRNA (guanine527-N7)-methyltransferase
MKMKDFDSSLLSDLIGKIAEADFLGCFDLHDLVDISERLHRYFEMVDIANKEYNIVGKSTIDSFFVRHVVDCAQLLIVMSGFFSKNGLRRDVYSVLDVGSGAGLPGLILLIFVKNVHVYMSEKSLVKQGFLKNFATSLHLDWSCEVLSGRFEDFEVGKFDVDIVTMRAFKSILSMLRLLDGMGLKSPLATLKGGGFLSEVEEARAEFEFNLVSEPSIVHPDGVSVIISNIENKK